MADLAISMDICFMFSCFGIIAKPYSIPSLDLHSKDIFIVFGQLILVFGLFVHPRSSNVLWQSARLIVLDFLLLLLFQSLCFVKNVSFLLVFGFVLDSKPMNALISCPLSSRNYVDLCACRCPK